MKNIIAKSDPFITRMMIEGNADKNCEKLQKLREGRIVRSGLFDTDRFISVYDLKGKYRYRYRVNENLFTPTVTILCEYKSYEISIKNPLVLNKNWYYVVDIKHPEFLITDVNHLDGRDFTKHIGILQIRSSTTNVEKKIAAFTGSHTVTEDIMDLIDIFFLNSDKSIYR